MSGECQKRVVSFIVEERKSKRLFTIVLVGTEKRKRIQYIS